MKKSATTMLSVHLRRRVGVLQRGLDRATASLSAARPQSIHRARVAARRLRAILRAYRHDFDPATARRYRRLLKALTCDLEPAREADVRRRKLADLAGEGVVDAALMQDVRGRAESDYGRAVRRLRSRMALQPWRQRLTQLRELSVRPALVHENAEPATAASDRVVKHHRQKLLGALRSADTNPKKLHKARLKVKVLRYLLEHGLPEGRVDPELKLLRRLQECLGDLHDNENVLAALRERHRHRDGMHDLCSRLEAHKSRNLQSFKKQKKSLMRRWRRIA